jgi:hypothetical protein
LPFGEHAIVIENPNHVFAHQATPFGIEVNRVKLEVAGSVFRDDPINVDN